MSGQPIDAILDGFAKCENALNRARATVVDLKNRSAAARKLLTGLIDHFDAMDGENDSALIAADLRNVVAALEGKPLTVEPR